MNEHRFSFGWAILLAIIAVVGCGMFPISHAAESDSNEPPVDESVGTAELSIPADSRTGNDADSAQLTPSEAEEISATKGDKSDSEANSGLGLTAPAAATDDIDSVGDEPKDESKRERLKWEDSVPPLDSEFDWIQLVSGEWLKGEFKTLYDYRVEFKSKKLKTLDLDWNDIRQLRTTTLEAVRVEQPDRRGEPITVYGVVTMEDEKVTVGRGDNARTFERKYIISIVKSGQAEIDFWTGNVSLGANIRSGNTDVTDATIRARIERRRAVSRLLLNYLGNFSSAEGIETSNNHRLGASFDTLKSTQLYWRVLFGEYLRDTFRNIQDQASLSTGLGYYLVRTPDTTWDVVASAGALYNRFVSVGAGRPAENTSPLLSLGTRYEDEVTSWLDVMFDINLQSVDEENGSLIGHTIVSLKTELTNTLDLELAWYWDYIKTPQPKADGTVPNQDDFRFVIGINFDF